jgi:hypothetical protein
MKRSKFTDEQILAIVKERATGFKAAVDELGKGKSASATY